MTRPGSDSEGTPRAWERISHDVIEACDIYTWGLTDESENNADDEFQLRTSLQDLRDLI
jgi:hypothetical protein